MDQMMLRDKHQLGENSSVMVDGLMAKPMKEITNSGELLLYHCHKNTYIHVVSCLPYVGKFLKWEKFGKLWVYHQIFPHHI